VLSQGTHLLTFRDSALVGHALLVPTGEEGVSEYAVFLHHDVRGRGLGTELNRAAIEAARAAGLKGLWLSVEPHNRAALRSYEKAGFTLLPGTLFSSEAEMRLTL
jgi:ribosomal protein S18 acetylase RimI-like enzyme